MIVKTLKPGDFSDDDQALVVTDFLALKKTQIREFLGNTTLPKSGTKEQIRERIERALNDKTISLSQIIGFLDEVIPWGKQHVFLYKGPTRSIADWKDTTWVTDLLKNHRLKKYVNAHLPLVLPEKMKVSSIVHNKERLRITAIKKREWWNRDSTYDDTTVTDEGDDVQLRAFVHRAIRSLVAFEWDLVANVAFLQISQLPSRFDYSEIAQEFCELIEGWLDIKAFSLIDLRPAIKKLHELEEAGRGETRSHGINYRTTEGRRFEGKSASPSDPLLGDANIDAALGAIRRTGVGHLGNFYWLPNHVANPGFNPLDAEIHVIVVGSKNRVNFPTPNTEQTVRYVLSRIRHHSS